VNIKHVEQIGIGLCGYSAELNIVYQVITLLTIKLESLSGCPMSFKSIFSLLLIHKF